MFQNNPSYSKIEIVFNDLRKLNVSHGKCKGLGNFSISGTGVRVKIHGEKSVRVGVKNALQKGWGLRFERIASTASVCTLGRKNGVPANSTERLFYFGSLPNPYDCLPAKADGAGNGRRACAVHLDR